MKPQTLPAINHSALKYITLFRVILLLTLNLDTICQERTDTLNVLELIKQPRYLETNKFTRQTKLTLRQTVFYNDTAIIDEEKWHILTIVFYNINLFRSRDLFDLKQDSSLLKCEYLYGGSEFSGGTYGRNIVGQIRVVSRSRKSVELELKLYVTTMKNDICFYKGKRKFELIDDFSSWYD